MARLAATARMGRHLVAVSSSLTLCVAAAHGQASRQIPLIAGLTVVTAVSQPLSGDYETIKRLDVVGPDGGVSLTVTGDQPNAERNRSTQFTVARTIRADDLKHARTYKYIFETDGDAEYPGSTAIGVSADVITDIRSKGRVAVGVNGETSGIGGLLGGVLTALTDSGGAGTLGLGPNASGTLQLADVKPVAFPVLVNATPTTLAAWHLKGRLDKGDQPVNVEWYVLDDPANPLTLRYVIGRDRLEVVRIELPPVDGGHAMERALLEERRSVLYGIYFDFNSATIKPESEAVLREIVQVMQREPLWTLRIEGHTDSVGGDAAGNKWLSARRADGVKAALVQRGVSAARLDTQGLGSTVPRETNATLQGRARNRRVELTRE